MIYNENFINFLKLSTGVCYKDSSHKEIITKCPWCESEKTRNHGHLYISSSQPIFICHRCNKKGIITKLISHLGGDVGDYINGDIKIIPKSKSSYIEDFEIKKYSYKYDELVYENKMNYMKSRLGEFDINKIPGLIFSINKFIKDNKIDRSSFDDNMINILEKNYIGFVLNRGTQIVFRSCVEGFERYRFLSLNNNKFFRDFYGVKLNNENRNINRIVLCEGIFDLLVSITSEELKHIRDNTCFWSSCLGKGYKNTLISVLDYCRIPFVDVTILSDSDVNKNKYYEICKLPFVNNLDVYWNKAGKDFGEKPINLYKTKINCFRKDGEKYDRKLHS